MLLRMSRLQVDPTWVAGSRSAPDSKFAEQEKRRKEDEDQHREREAQLKREHDADARRLAAAQPVLAAAQRRRAAAELNASRAEVRALQGRAGGTCERLVAPGATIAASAAPEAALQCVPVLLST